MTAVRLRNYNDYYYSSHTCQNLITHKESKLRLPLLWPCMMSTCTQSLSNCSWLQTTNQPNAHKTETMEAELQAENARKLNYNPDRNRNSPACKTRPQKVII